MKSLTLLFEEHCWFKCWYQEVVDSTVVDVNDPSDQQVEKIEQERLVLQLKEMVRDREDALASKDAELRVILTYFIATNYWNIH